MGMGQDLSPRRDHRSEYIIYLYLYIYLLRFFQILYLQTAILRKKKPYFRESFANPMFISRGNLMLKSFAKSFAKKKKRELRKNFRGVSCWNPAALAIKNPYMDL